MKKNIIKFLRKVLDVTLPVESKQNSQLLQKNLFFQYRNLSAQTGKLPSFEETGFRVYSQSDEDGLLLYLFSLIGFSNHFVLDIASGSPIGGNTTNLILNWGCHGLLIEGNEKLVAESVAFYNHHPDAELFPPRIKQAWVTAENINQLVINEGLSGEIDLFSLDVDGVDYWLWKSLDVVSPRVVMVEYQDMFIADESLTIPYKSDFNRFDIHPDYFGASLAAFVNLAHKKGYRLVGCNRYGYNAFFVRNDLAVDILPEVTVESCLSHPRIHANRESRRKGVLHLSWQAV